MKNKNLRYFIIYLSITILSLLTCSIYYIFSHGEQDLHMTLLFVPGLTMSIFFFILYLCKFELHHVTYYLLNSAFSFLFTYMLLMGIYLIAYVESSWIFVFIICSVSIGAIAVINETIYRIRKSKK